jgi:NADH-quinone oxidoreductase subunit A
MPYESGNDPAGEVKRFPVHFYAVAMLFIIFDVEVAFLWPYAVSAGALGVVGCCLWASCMSGTRE